VLALLAEEVAEEALPDADVAELLALVADVEAADALAAAFVA
jgi:hypothetical protein